MQPDRIQIRVRTRTGWEAIDLGFHMVRAWWKPIYLSWLTLVLPLMLGCLYVLWDYPVWAILVIWWLKPLYERLPLHVLSEALFGAPPGLGSVLKHAPHWLRGGTLASLTWQRPVPTRSMTLPIAQLERLTGPRRVLRHRLIVGYDVGRASWLLLACSLFQLFPIAAGLAGIALVFAPGDIGLLDVLDRSTDDPDIWLRTIAGLYAVSLTCIEPLYVAAGFALYINRRIFIEGWDIDLVFRKLTRRVRTAADRKARAGHATGLRRSAGAALVWFALMLPGALLRADPPDEARAEGSKQPCEIARAEEAADCMDAILQDPVFGGTATEEYRVPTWWSDDEDPEVDLDTTLDMPQGSIVTRLLQLTVLLAIGLAAVSLWRYAKRKLETDPNAPDRDRDSAREADPTLSRRIGPVPLPSNPIAEARREFGRGDPVAALSLLYRGALACLADRGIEMPSSATESECARRVHSRVAGPLAGDFDALVRAWELCAYGSQPPDERTFGELCGRWETHLTAVRMEPSA